MTKRRAWRAARSSSDDGSPARRQRERVKVTRRSWQCPASSSSDVELIQVGGPARVIAVSDSDDSGAAVQFARSGGSAQSRCSEVAPQVVHTKRNRPIVDISEPTLLCKVGQERQPRTQLTSFERNGCNEERIRNVLKSPCCKKGCLMSLAPLCDRAVRLCSLWHSHLSASERRSFMHHAMCRGDSTMKAESDYPEYCQYRLCGY